MKRALLAAMLVSLVVLVRPAYAAGDAPAPQDSDAEVADRLFREGTDLLSRGSFAEACPKFEESERRDPALGTQFNLAVCYERTGRLRSARDLFVDVAKKAHEAGKDEREKSARGQATAIEARLAHLTLVVGAGSASRIVKLDGVALGPSEVGASLAVDPGAHRVEAVTPGAKTWEASVTLAPGKSQLLVIPGATPETPATPDTTNAAAPERASDPVARRAAGYVVGAVGVAGIAAAVMTSVLIASAKSTADDKCASHRNGADCTDAISRGKGMLPVNAVAWGVGIVGLGVGGYLLLTSRAPSPAPLASASRGARIFVEPLMTRDGARLSFGGTF